MSASFRGRAGGATGLVVLVLALASCRSPVVTPRGAPVEPAACAGGAAVADSVFLIGDAGAPRLPTDGSSAVVDPVLAALHRDVQASAAKLGASGVSTIFLGDNIYQDGLPAEGAPKRRTAERKLEAQIAASEPGAAVFVMGNHDWHIQGPEGWDRVLAQRRFLEPLAPRVQTRPLAGCGGPEHLDVGAHLRLVFIDPIGAVHALEHPELHRTACARGSLLDSYDDLAAEFDHPDGRHVGLALHHPMITAGPHGGHFTWKQHLFPLTDFWSWAWLPLPVIGSVYPVSRQLGVTGTDIASEAYTRDIVDIYRASRPGVPAFFVGGHEHSLQVHRDMTGVYYLVSGAGSVSKVDRVEPERLDTVMLAEARPGYMQLDVREDGSLELAVTAVDARGEPETLLRHCLAEGLTEPRGRPARSARR